jgi:hypothetical protein
LPDTSREWERESARLQPRRIPDVFTALCVRLRAWPRDERGVASCRSFHFSTDVTLARFIIALVAGPLSVATHAQTGPDYEQPPISYSTATPRDAVAALQREIDAGRVSLAGGGRQALATLLEALRVPIPSQLLVFSKTSLQRGLIRPERPRAIYFSDHVSVGWVPGGMIEVAAIDPVLGPVFYAIDVRGRRSGAPTIVREADCLRCHGGTFVREIPGVFARSVFADTDGEPLLRHGTKIVEDETPFAERWGGWYVTGYHGGEPHRGNAFASERENELAFTPSAERPDELGKFFDTSEYLAPTSDVVALLVFEHQTTMQNSLTRAGNSARKMIAYQHSLQKAFKEPVTDEPAYDSVKSVFASAAQDVVDKLLFRQAAPLPEGLVGSETFRRAFAAAARRTSTGDSLRDFHLHGRLFAQRCSHLIYSESFSALPEPLKARIFDRLLTTLLSNDPKDRYAYLDMDEKRRIFQILSETHPEARAHWNGETEPASAP